MKVISTKVHGFLDYAVAVLLIISPWVLGFEHSGAAANVLITSGIITILYSLITDYEYSLAGFIRMKTHLVLDTCSALVIIASPWIFGFQDAIHIPHIIFGLTELTVISLSQTSMKSLNERSKTKFQNI